MSEHTTFVARERELTRLAEFLKLALGGTGQVCFVVGEAGSGKTALVSEFAQRAQEKYKDLIVVVGQCDAQTGVGDPYLPFREILNQLSGDVEGDVSRGVITDENASRLKKFLQLSGQAIVETGPDLISLFLPVAGFLARVGSFVAEKAGWVEKLEGQAAKAKEGIPSVNLDLKQDHIFEQYTNVIKGLAMQHPLLMVLDDLHWADAASMDLLFRLGRRIGDSRILIIGTYRPGEVAIGRSGERHPLEKVIAEFKRYYGDILVNLDQTDESEREKFIDAFIGTEPNRLSDTFRQALFKHTGGHPLFTIELLRTMQERGDIIHDEKGRWVEGPVLNWEKLPASVEGVIEERIARVEDQLREALTVASVEGENFTAEIVARVQDEEVRELIRHLSGELEKRHRLVSALGVKRLGELRLSEYRFRHNLFQKYLYNTLDNVERAHLHEDVGNVLEELYGPRANEIAVQLARHFSCAGMDAKAQTYLHQAGIQAASVYANLEAIDYLNHAQALAEESDTEGNLALIFAREKVYDVLGDRRAQKEDIDALQGIVETMDDSPDAAKWKAEVVLRQASFSLATGDYPVTSKASQEAIRFAQISQDASIEAEGYRLWGLGLSHMGEYEQALDRLEKALRIKKAIGDRKGESSILNALGSVYHSMGSIEESKIHREDSLLISREIGDRMGEGKALNNLGLIASLEGDIPGTSAYYQQALDILRQIGYRLGEGVILQNLGVLFAKQGDFPQANNFFNQALTVSREIDDRYSEGRVLGNLGNAASEQGDYDTAKSYFEQSIEIYQEIGNRSGESLFLVNLGNLHSDLGDYAQAGDYYEQALHIAREIGTPDIESSVLYHMGTIHNALGEYTPAIERIERALEIIVDLGDKDAEGNARSNLGEIAYHLGDYGAAQAQFEQSLEIGRQIGDRIGESHRLAYLGLLFDYEGEEEQAIEYCREALQIAQEIGDRNTQALGWTSLGHILSSQAKLEEADAAYNQALDLREELNQNHLSIEPLAGKANVLLKQGNVKDAKMHLDEVLAHLELGPPNGTISPGQIYLTCILVLQADDDPRAQSILESAHQVLKEQAAGIKDDSLQQSFLNNVPAHREILKSFAHTIEDV
jgi:predicted ATPase/Tfp pilus assembly protein PilF